MSDKIKPFYCVKYVLSNKGKIPRQGLKVGDEGEYAYGDHHIQYHIGRNCFEREADAVSAAVRMRDRKIASLRKQIAELDKLQFNTPLQDNPK